MNKLNKIIEWSEFGSEHRMYIKHYWDKDDKVNINIVYEDATHDKVTEINIPNKKLKQFLACVNGDLLSKKYEINV